MLYSGTHVLSCSLPREHYIQEARAYISTSYSAERSDYLFRAISNVKNNSHAMDEEELLFGVERVLIDSAKIL